MTLKRGYMQQVIENILEEYSKKQANLSSDTLREHLAKDIIHGINLFCKDELQHWIEGDING